MVLFSYLGTTTETFSVYAVNDHLDPLLPLPEPFSFREKIWEQLNNDLWINILCYGLAYAARWTVLRRDHGSRIPEYVAIAALTWSILAPIFNILGESPLNSILLYCISSGIALSLMNARKIEIAPLKGSVITLSVFSVARVLNDIFQE